LNGTSSDPPLGPPVPNWLPRQLPPLAVMNGRTCRVEPIDSTRHGAALYAAYATDLEGRLWTYLPWGPYSGAEELCARIDAVRASGVRPEYALIDLASGKLFGQASYLNISRREHRGWRDCLRAGISAWDCGERGNVPDDATRL
jgi:hypothetical protein